MQKEITLANILHLFPVVQFHLYDGGVAETFRQALEYVQDNIPFEALTSEPILYDSFLVKVRA